MSQWEYDMKKINRNNWMQAKSELNKLGDEGWELCHFDEVDQEGKATGFFKRIKN